MQPILHQPAPIAGAIAQRPVLCADHRLEWMQCWQNEPARRKPTQSLYELPLPTWILDEPLRLIERDNRPHYQGPLQLLLGPDRVEGGWWHRSSTGEDALPLNDFFALAGVVARA